MKKRIPIAAILLLLFTVFYSCQQADSSAAVPGAVSKDSLIKKGAYLVTIMGCNDCHSPKRMGPNGPELDPERLLSGYNANGVLPRVPDSSVTNHWALFNQDLTAAVGPWGTSFAANLTSDPTGLGGWTLERFSKAIREGKYNGIEGTRSILPPMPIPSFIHLKDEDLEAIFAYLQSTRPVKNLVPQPIPPGAH